VINVLFDIPNTPAWIAGLNYFVNLFNALYSLPERLINPIILGSPDNLPQSLQRSSFISRYSPPIPSYKNFRYVRNLLESCFSGQSRDYERYLHHHKVDLLSHITFPTGPTSVPVLVWIPDFQHHHLPHFFSREEIDKRCHYQAQAAESAQGILLSSEDARNDFNRFHPGYEHKTHVLRFVAAPCAADELPTAEYVFKKYNIKEPFFHVPNQLWVHKNHSVILDALCILRQRGHCPLVISTGRTEDHRKVEYFAELSQRVRGTGMDDRLLFLGFIDYREVCVFMRMSVALINPSLFEGWSTTVEEAKSLGKRMLLSSIPVHREQGYERSNFFEPLHAEQLALLMEEALESYDQDQEAIAMETATHELPNRMRQFGRNYETIVYDVLGRH
jgi:glycosyltransferase involved in cell wall biosynthesis